MNFNFHPKMLNPKSRSAGISAFIRTRNGEDFLKITIESHIDFFDEIVACYNDCNDKTEEILNSLEKKYPNKLKVYHYLPKVYPPGSEEHKILPSDSENSLANYYNFALSKTTRKVAVKLDDDHFAVPANLRKAISYVKKNSKKGCRYTFSGINLSKDENDTLGVHSNNPFSGGGDIEFFTVSENTYFINSERCELFKHPKSKKKYLGILYLHLKFLKKGYGFKNYDLNTYKNSPYAKQLKDFKANRKFEPIEFFANQNTKKLFKTKSTIKRFLLNTKAIKKLYRTTGLDYKTGLKNSRAMNFKDDIVDVQKSIKHLENLLKS